MSTSLWADLVKQLGGNQFILNLNQALGSDRQFLAFTHTDALAFPIVFGIKSAEGHSSILVHVSNHLSYASEQTSQHKEPLFSISASPEEWEQFFQKVPQPGFQNFWGMIRYRMDRTDGATLSGSKVDYARHAHLVRRVLDLMHETYCGDNQELEEDGEEMEGEDFIQSHYTWLTLPLYGRCKVFIEQSGEGQQEILFLHTAGADSRQYHALMNDPQLRQLYRMSAFDLPSHGRSFPAPNLPHGAHTLTEDAYIAVIVAIIRAKALNRPIVVGASMAGQICLAVAIRNAEVYAGGVVPLEACDYIERERQWNDKSPFVNASLFNPEVIYGLCAPTAPEVNKRLIWHTYSAQAYGVFHGDLDFYNGGWDGRSRMAGIDIGDCPMYLLTGEYDYSTTPEMSRKTAGKVSGAMFEEMKGLGHFPATEDPEAFKPYLIKAVKWIQEQQKNRKAS